jgi:hypothetical protein
MDLVNDLSSDVALAVFVEGRLRQKLDDRDAKSFIALLEAELSRISADNEHRVDQTALAADLSH